MQLFDKLKGHDLAILPQTEQRWYVDPPRQCLMMLAWKYIDQHKSQMEKPIRSTLM